MGLSQKFLTRVGSGQPFMVWVWIWKISPKNVKFFNFFPFGSKKSLRVKGGLASYLMRVKSKLGSGQGPSLTAMHWIPLQAKVSEHNHLGNSIQKFKKACLTEKINCRRKNPFKKKTWHDFPIINPIKSFSPTALREHSFVYIALGHPGFNLVLIFVESILISIQVGWYWSVEWMDDIFV